MNKVRNWLIAGLGTMGLIFGGTISTLALTAGQSGPAVAVQAPQLTLYDG